MRICLLLLSLSVSCTWNSLKAQADYSPGHPISDQALSYFELGEKANQSGETAKAKALYYRAIYHQGNFVEAMDNLAVLYKQENHLDSARYFFEKSLSFRPDGIVANLNLAALNQLEGQTEPAIKAYQQLLKYHPNCAEGYYGLAMVYLNNKDGENAIKFAEFAMQLYMNNQQMEAAAEARMLAARGYMEQKNYKRAVKYVKACKKQFQDKPFYYYYLGLGNLKMGKNEDALENLEKAREMGYQLPTWVTDRMQHMLNS